MRRSVLLLDPEPTRASALAAQLQSAGFDITPFFTAGDALVRLARPVFGSMIVMADLHDADCCKCLVDLRKVAPTVWLIVVAYDHMPGSLKLARKLGADAILTTPFSIADLAQRLAAFSSGHTAGFGERGTRD